MYAWYAGMMTFRNSQISMLCMELSVRNSARATAAAFLIATMRSYFHVASRDNQRAPHCLVPQACLDSDNSVQLSFTCLWLHTVNCSTSGKLARQQHTPAF